MIVLGYIGIVVAPFIVGFILTVLLEFIKNNSLKKFLSIIFYVLLFPAMYSFSSAITLTDEEKKGGRFNPSFRLKIQIILITYALYVLGYILLFTKVF